MANENILPYKIYGNNVLHPCSGENSIDNTIVVGSSGVGKTYGYLNNNLMYDNNSNYIAVMLEGTIESLTGRKNVANLFPAGFDVKVISTDLKDVHFNPMIYMEDRADIEELAKSIIYMMYDKLSAPFDTDMEKALVNYLLVILLTIKDLWGNPHGYNYHPEKYNLVSAWKFVDKSYAELEELVRKAVVNSEASDFGRDKLNDCWNTLCARLIDNKDIDFEKLQLKMKQCLMDLNIPKIKEFLSGEDNIQLYDMFDINEKAIVIEASSIFSQSNIFAVKLFLSVTRILISKNQFEYYTKLLIDEFQCCGNIYKANDFFKIRPDYSCDILIQSTRQLKQIFSEGANILLGKSNIIFMGEIIDYEDRKKIEELTGLSNYRQENDVEIIINNCPDSKFHAYTVCEKI